MKNKKQEKVVKATVQPKQASDQNQFSQPYAELMARLGHVQVTRSFSREEMNQRR